MWLFFLIFSMVLVLQFQSSQSTADLLKIVSELLGLLTGLGQLKTVALDIPKTFDRVWYARLLHKLNSYSISSRIFGLISVISNRWLWVVLDGKSLYEYAAGGGAPQRSILRSSFSLFHINDLTDDVICNTTIYAGNTILYSKCDQASNFWQELILASELESDLETLWTGTGSGLLISILGKFSSCCLISLITLVLWCEKE